MAFARYGCWFLVPNGGFDRPRYYLPQVQLKAHTTIQSTVSRTKLLQVFENDTKDNTPEIKYTFPLYDGVSIVSFKCTIGDKVIVGIVKEKNQAQADYNEAVARGESAALLEQAWEASDVFLTKIGNVPKGAKAVVEIEYIGELQHDAQLDGVRFMLPTAVAPRYGSASASSESGLISTRGGDIEIVVDVEVDENTQIEGLSSPSHPIAVTLGRTSTQKEVFKGHRASATLSLGSAELGKDFIIVINAPSSAIPKALLERHPDFPNHRAIMTTLVPKFNLPNTHPEIVFVVDRSGSMGGKIPTLVEALKVFLKSLPLSAKFNICSFGSNFTFLFDKSAAYDERSLQTALGNVDTFAADYGGTELLSPIQEAVRRRLKGVPLEIMVLTDGEIWNQQQAFDFMNEASKDDVRLFSLGIGAGASTALVEGLARAGKGFAQFVQDNEKMDKVVVRMLKAALTPHITDYRLEVDYNTSKATNSSDDDYEMVESTNKVSTNLDSKRSSITIAGATPISLFDPTFKESTTSLSAGRYDHLPSIDPPSELQAPSEIRGLFPYNRVSAYLLLPESTKHITSVTLKGTYQNAPVQLKIQVQDIGIGKTVHQLAAKKAMLELEEGRGWLSTIKEKDGRSLKTQYEADWDRIVEREAVGLGVKFQIAGKFCSFVAIEENAQKQGNVVDVIDPRSEPPQQRSLRISQHVTRFSSSISRLGANTYAPPPPPMAMPASLSFGAPAPAPGGSPIFGNIEQKRKTSASLRSRSAQYDSAPPSGALFGNPQPQAVGFGSPTPKAGIFGKNPFKGKLFGGGNAPSPWLSNSSSRSESTSEVRFSEAQKSSSGAPTADFGFSGAGFAAPSMPNPPSTKPVAHTIEDKIHRIIGLQRFDGSWAATQDLYTLTDIWAADFESASLKYTDDSVKATLLAIAWFEKVASKDAEIWEMVVEKAKQWLTDNHGITDTDAAVVQAVSVFFP